MWLKVLGGVLLVWLAFTVLGALFKFLTWALVIGAVVFVGAAAYTAVRARNRRALGR
jgi:O-antigen/teichoic acid export membrane protein